MQYILKIPFVKIHVVYNIKQAGRFFELYHKMR